MTYYGGKEMAASFRTVRKNTIQVAQDLPEERYRFVPGEGGRTIAQMLVHVALAPRFFWQEPHSVRPTTFEGFDFFGAVDRMQAEEAAPRTKAQIIDLLTSEGEAFATFLEGLSEEELAERIALPWADGGSKIRLEMLLSAKEHEMHHRAQLMLVERQLGIVPHLTRQANEWMAQARKASGA
jgi:uncharacterized damage-inducible protein DinB